MNARPYLVYKEELPAKTLQRPRWPRKSLADTFRTDASPDPVKGYPDDGVNRIPENDNS